MKSVLAFLAIAAFFVACNLVAAGVFWALGRTVQIWVPGADREPWVWLLIGLAAIAAAIGFAIAGVKVIGRASSRARVRAPG